MKISIEKEGKRLKTRNLVLLILGVLTGLFIIITTTVFGIYYVIKEKGFEMVVSISTEEKVERDSYSIHHSVSKDRVKEIEEALSSVFELGETWFGQVDMNEKLIIKMVSNDEKLLTASRTGEYDIIQNAIRVNQNLNKESFYGTLAHEVAHAYTQGYIYNKEKVMMTDVLPLWFIEGIADTFSYQLYDRYYSDSPYEEWNEIEPFHNIPNEAVGFSHYELSRFAVEHLVSEYGLSIITDIIDETLETNDFEGVFNKKTDYLLSDYHKLFEFEEDEYETILKLLEQKEEDKAEKAIVKVLEEKPEYFMGASFFYSQYIYILEEQNRHEEALELVEKFLKLDYSPISLLRASKIAVNSDKELALEYGKQALHRAEVSGYELGLYQKWLKDLSEE